MGSTYLPAANDLPSTMYVCCVHDIHTYIAALSPDFQWSSTRYWWQTGRQASKQVGVSAERKAPPLMHQQHHLGILPVDALLYTPTYAAIHSSYATPACRCGWSDGELQWFTGTPPHVWGEH